MHIEIIPAYDRKEDILSLFAEYMDMLLLNDPSFRVYLDIQNYEAELLHLEGKYGLPHGRLYLLLCDGAVAGCIALRRLDDARCELKRLYVRPAFRGRGLGTILVERLIADAREMGYKAVLLDTLPFLKTAIAMYQRLGFYEIPRYNDSPMDSTIYMQLDL